MFSGLLDVAGAARRARTLLATCTPLEVEVAGRARSVARHLVDESGAIVARPDLLAVPEEAGPPGARLEIADVAAAPQPDRLRARLRLEGYIEVERRRLDEPWSSRLGLAPGSLVSRLVPERVAVEVRVPGRAADRIDVSLADFRRARPDGLAGWEAGWVEHLAAHHGPELWHVVTAAGHDIPDGARVCPVGADEGGLDVRIYTDDEVRCVRVPFAERAGCACQALDAFGVLLARPLV